MHSKTHIKIARKNRERTGSSVGLWSSRAGAHSSARVSPAPSKIPYGEFSPVRLQTSFQARDLHDTRRGLSAVHIRRLIPFIRWLSVRARPLARLSGGSEHAVPKAQTRGRISRFNRARFFPTSTRSSRGPWLAGRLCCPPRSSLTTASSATLKPVRQLTLSEPPTPEERSQGGGSRASPIYSLGLSRRATSPTPVDHEGYQWLLHPPRLWPSPWCDGLGIHIVLFRGCRVRFMLRPGRFASPPFEDVYFRACTQAGRPVQVSNITTWAHSQFPRPDFHR